MRVPELYARQDAFTDPGACAGLYDDLPRSPAELRGIVSQLIIHTARTARYGIPPDTPMSRETQTAETDLDPSPTTPDQMTRQRESDPD